MPKVNNTLLSTDRSQGTGDRTFEEPGTDNGSKTQRHTPSEDSWGDSTDSEMGGVWKISREYEKLISHYVHIWFVYNTD